MAPAVKQRGKAGWAACDTVWHVNGDNVLSILMRAVSRLVRFGAQHWRGQHSLVVTLLVNLLGLRLLLGAAQSIVPTPLLFGFLFASQCALIWQWVGAWRAIDNHTRSVGGMAWVWAGYAVIAVVTLLSCLQALDALSRLADPPSPPGGKPYVEFQLPVEASGRVAVVEGPIGWPHHTALARLLEGENAVEQVRLSSDGGLVIAARSLAALVQQYSLDTHVEGRCFSACTLVLLAGERRTLSNAASLGFHQYKIDSQIQLRGVDLALELEKDRQYLASRGVSAAFVQRVFQADAEDMWIPARSELVEAGVISP